MPTVLAAVLRFGDDQFLDVVNLQKALYLSLSLSLSLSLFSSSSLCLCISQAASHLRHANFMGFCWVVFLVMQAWERIYSPIVHVLFLLVTLDPHHLLVRLAKAV